ncbi:MAG TPA: alpha-2-macroglobulin family protein, partial [Pyrinomonadaceae bacterium]|nr:alpha-2-macroglobulin family protein [Pyrinomonadaceae bacterium]
VRTERISVDGPSMVLKVPVEESFVPGFSVKVDLYGSQKRIFFEDERDKKLPDRPAYASGELTIDVAKTTRQLTVSAEARKRDLAPGGETEIEIAVMDDKGRPASGTEVAVVAADESVLALTDYHVGDPTDSFYTGVYPRVSSEYSRGSVILANPWDFLPKSEQELLIGAGRGAGYGNGDGNGVGDGSGGGVSFGLYDVGGMIPRRDADSPFRRLELITSLQRPPNVKEIRMRQNFSALALFSPSVRTDADGRATVKLKLPDNLTRYRITAVAATESNKFGKSESTVTASQPLMIRPSAPRFLNLGDRAEVSVVVQNTTGETRSVNVAIRSTNARFTDGVGRRVNVPANDRVELRFPVSTASPGLARFQVGGVSGELADAAEFALPVLTPVTSEAFATYGTTDQNGAFAIPIAAPKDVITEYGGVEVTTSSTQMQELTDALIYLQTYPFECTEQRSSRMLSTAALRDVLEAFKSEKLPPKEGLEDRMADDIAKLVKLQHKDGGWSYWRTDDSSVPYVSVHVTHALFR